MENVKISISPEAKILLSLKPQLTMGFTTLPAGPDGLKPDLYDRIGSILDRMSPQTIDQLDYELDAMTEGFVLSNKDLAHLGSYLSDHRSYVRARIIMSLRAIIYFESAAFRNTDAERIAAREAAEAEEEQAS